MNNVLGKLGRFVALVVILFIVGLVVVVYVRLDDQVLSMVAGFLMLGIPLLIFIVAGIVILWLIVRAMEARAKVRQYDPRQMMPLHQGPPVIVMNPNGQVQQPPMLGGGLPYLGGNGTHQPEMGAQRPFRILGAGGD